MPKRPTPPKIKDIAALQLPPVARGQLSNGVPYYHIALGTQPVSKVEIVFQAGHVYEQAQLVAGATLRMLREGTRNYHAAQIAEQLDFYGLTLRLSSGLDTSSIILYCLNKHLSKALPILADMISAPSFPERELAAYKQRRIRQLDIDLKQNDKLADRQIAELIFGTHHPYGYNNSAAGYQALECGQLSAHHRRLYHRQNCTIFISGPLSQELMKLLDEHLSPAISSTGSPASAKLPQPPSTAEQQFIRLPGTLQASIRLGRRLFNRQHQDYKGMYVLNNILGGYFGSRLMANLREEKGYTYNIYAALDAMRFDGSLQVGTEVALGYVEDTRRQIFLEMERLQQELVAPEEMQMVRNYLLGTFLTMLDGPFNVSEVVRTLVLDELPLSYFEELVDTVRAITAEEIRVLAQKYLQKKDMWEVIVGP